MIHGYRVSVEMRTWQDGREWGLTLASSNRLVGWMRTLNVLRKTA